MELFFLQRRTYYKENAINNDLFFKNMEIAINFKLVKSRCNIVDLSVYL